MKNRATATQAAAASARLARATRGEHRRIMGTRLRIMVRKQGPTYPHRVCRTRRRWEERTPSTSGRATSCPCFSRKRSRQGTNTGGTRAWGHGEPRESFSPQRRTLLLTRPQNRPPSRSRGEWPKCLKNRPIRQVGLLGLEPRTYGLKVRCSNQLSYSPTTILPALQNRATGPQNGRKPLESRRKSPHVEPGGCPSKPHRIAQPRQRRLRDR